MKNLIIGDLIAKLPIIQGGMGVGISLSGLSSSVANQGGVGVIATAGIGMHEPDFNSNFLESNIRALRKQIQKARELSRGIIGVNIMVALTNFSDLVKTAIEEKIDIIFSGAGLPLNLPEYLKGSKKTKLVPIVSSGKAARIISQKWQSDYDYLPDAIVVEGPKAGGHLGFKPEQIDDPDYSLENLVPDVLRQVRPIEDKNGKTIPVIAAGGIYTGQDIHDIMELGAAGVQMATRFVPTVECDASIEFKKCYIDAKKKDLGIIKSPVGMPGRAILNDFLKSVAAGKKQPFRCPYHCIATCEYKDSPYCIALALLNAKKGNMKHGFAFAGQNAYRSTSIVSVKELVETLKREYNEAERLSEKQ
ncbi:MAG: nitronate monooxygenase [Eubacteriales bacterium]|nr:nitronate monooxygenase [Eubacteriales bacterium]